MQSKSEYISYEREEFGGELDAEMLQDARDTAQAQAAYNEAGLNGRAINWRYWVHQMPALKAMQAACLMSALEPDIFANLNERPGKIDPAKCIEKARKIQRLAEAHGWLTASPAEWVEWAKKHRVSVHVGFRLAVSELLDTAGDDEEAAPVSEDNPSERAQSAAKAGTSNKKTWDDAKLRSLWEESIMPGVTHKSLSDKYGVSRQRIATLIGLAKKKFRVGGKSLNTWGGLVHKMEDDD